MIWRLPKLLSKCTWSKVRFDFGTVMRQAIYELKYGYDEYL